MLNPNIDEMVKLEKFTLHCVSLGLRNASEPTMCKLMALAIYFTPKQLSSPVKYEILKAAEVRIKSL